MRRILSILTAILIFSVSQIQARDLVSRVLVSQGRSLRIEIIENPVNPPPPDQRSGESVLTLAFTETTPAGSDRMMVVGVCHRTSTNTITSVVSSVDGALTLVSSDSSASGATVRGALYRLIAPTVGAHVITVTASQAQNMTVGAAHYNNVNQTTPLGTVTVESDLSTVLASATQRVVLSHLCASLSNASSLIPATGQQQKWFSSAGISGSSNRMSAFSDKPGAASVQMDWTSDGTPVVVHQVVDLRPPGDDGDPPEPPDANYLVNKDFEDSNIALGLTVRATCCEDGVSQTIVTSPVRTGTKAVKMVADSSVTMPDTDPATRPIGTGPGNTPTYVWSNRVNDGVEQLVRAELGRSGIGSTHGGREGWYGFSVYIDPSFVDETLEGVLISQWHSNKDACDVTISPHLSINFYPGDVWRIENLTEAAACAVVGGYTRFTLNVAGAKGVWVDWVVYAKWSYNNDGILKVWKDGNLIVDRNGVANSYNNQNQELHRIGIYTSRWSSRQPPKGCPCSPTRQLIVYYDNYRITDSSGSYAAVDPSQ